MRIKMVKAIFKKEMIDILRDKKTLFMGIVLPLILYPVLMVLMTQVMTVSNDTMEKQEINISFEKTPNKSLINILNDYTDDTTSNINIVKSEEIAGSLLGQILPAILMMGVLLGAIYPAIDSMAGEKERGTLETLFTLPISNLELVMGKYMAVSFCAIVTAVLNVISILLTLLYLVTTGGMAGDTFLQDFNMYELAGPLLITLVCICLFAMVVSAVSMCVCSLAKSFKDAQNYITPVMFLVLIPSYASMIPTMSLNSTTAVIPVVNISLLIKSVLSFNSNLGLISLVFLTNFLFVILSVVLLSKMFNSEEILFGNSRSFTFLEKRSNIKVGTMPSISDGIILYALGLVLLIYLGSYVQLRFKMGGLVMTQIMILGLPLLFAYYIKSDFKKVFSLRLPSFVHLIASFSLWIGTYMIVNLITQIILHFFPQNMEVIESLNNFIFGNSSLLVQILVVALMPAICEEIFFRGFLLTSFRNNKKSASGAIVLSGVLFGFMHMDFIRVIPTALLGISFAYAVYKSNSIGVSMFMHFLNNGFAVVITYMVTKLLGNMPAPEVGTLSLYPIIILLVMGTIFISLAVALFNIKEHN